MKKYLFYFVILIQLPLFSQFQNAPWKQIAKPVDKTLKHLFFLNPKTGWAAGEAGTIIKTTDGGYNWQTQTTNIETFIVDLFFLNENIGWALTIKETSPFGTTILRTTNGGNDWLREDFPQGSVIMNTIFFFDSLNGLIGGRNISKTTDGGLTWEVMSVDSSIISNLPVNKFRFYSRDFGYACGGFTDLAGVIWKTTNGGNNWSTTGVSPDQVFDLYIKDSLNAISLSGDPEGIFGIGIVKTTDAGANWEFDEMPLYGLSFSIDFRNSMDAWSACGFQFLHSQDGGISWISELPPANDIVYDLKFFNEQSGIAVGDSGIILKYIPPPLEVNENIIAIDFKLGQNYPNPFNSITKIKFSIPPVSSPLVKGRKKEGFVTLKVYDIIGREITTLVNEEMFAGDYEVEFNTDSHSGLSGIGVLTSGVYFYQLKADDFVKTKKMVLLR